ncbi:amino acid/amide ABC transporter ATP-binding protein 1, HAAT family [Rhizobiales bacterium GAS191]|jgi:branched-chain amino acid transport system ATP-binding protein|nr:amino acid/amide ABC transporter ATP-binding protein 1, HAAT family [Rhizobiales bacterium GAS113]SED98789.1 amino acid/amide ABC transporter ATP-binding protein 1, HAAT family [Rhizobiales bacterium GAS188]SEE54288.1 amino acid/amide ABC transporter ATP-binding protein 1, HAAT family [Rhizobiales bacterium GAS191]
MANVIETQSLTKQFKGFVAVSNVDLRVAEGSIHGLIGPNGAGKTTCFNLLTKFLEPSGGRIFHRGEDITGLKPAAIARRGVVRSFQISAVFPHLTVRDNLRAALQRQNGLAHQFWLSDKTLRVLDERASKLIADVNLTEFQDTPAGELAYGRKRALEIATTLALDPEVLLLDEPMAGIGREDLPRIIDLVRQIAKGRTVVMVEHNLSVVANLCDRVTVLQRGEILAEGSYAEVSADARVRTAYMGSDHGH